ncbi:hypothetical protein [Streptomyces sp. NPDC058398]|uniref:hypothetical protein n=1 Tax=Streptomyces sp. NPDC058398 TaxID=3346479 RepID=UPI0036626C56
MSVGQFALINHQYGLGAALAATAAAVALDCVRIRRSPSETALHPVRLDGGRKRTQGH